MAEGEIYRVSVHDYTNRASNPSAAMAGSSAQVAVMRGSLVEAVFYVPNLPGTLWTVFTLENNRVIPPMTALMGYESTSGNISAFSLLGNDSLLDPAGALERLGTLPPKMP